jgi:hypothetical protein
MSCSQEPAIDFVRLLVDWVPFVVFVGLMIYFMRKGIGGKQAQYMESMERYYADHLEETRQIRADLARIAAALEKRNSG